MTAFGEQSCARPALTSCYDTATETAPRASNVQPGRLPLRRLLLAGSRRSNVDATSLPFLPLEGAVAALARLCTRVAAALEWQKRFFMASKTSPKPQALISKGKASTPRAAKLKSISGTKEKPPAVTKAKPPAWKAGSMISGHMTTFAAGVPKPLTGKQASKAVREAGVVTASGNLKARFR